jgi:hypothetical protein
MMKDSLHQIAKIVLLIEAAIGRLSLYREGHPQRVCFEGISRMAYLAVGYSLNANN